MGAITCWTLWVVLVHAVPALVVLRTVTTLSWLRAFELVVAV